MGPPGGGRQDITERIMHHFYWVNFANYSDENLLKIFSSMLSIGLQEHSNDVKQMIEKVT